MAEEYIEKLNEGLEEEFEEDFEEESLDVINSLAVYKAKEAGLFGREEIDIEDTGILGATITDFQKTTARLASDKISPEQAKDELEESFTATVKCFLNKVTDVVLDPVTKVLEKKMPVLATAVEGVKEFIKTKVVSYVAEKVAVGAKKVFNFFKNLFKA